MLLAASSFLPLLTGASDRPGAAWYLEIVAAGGSPERIALSDDGIRRITGPLGETVVEISGGRVRVKESPCANRLCIREGWKGGAGQVIVCAPNRVGLFLRGMEGGVDAVSR